MEAAAGSVYRLLAGNASGLRPSDIRLITQHIARESLTPLRLDIGEPDLPTPDRIVQAAIEASRLPSRYAPAAGTIAFREAASAFLLREHALAVSPEDIVATPGATGGLAAVFALLCEPGDEVLVPTPGFPSYRTQLALVGAVPVGYELRGDCGWIPDLELLAKAVTGRTKAIVLNTPGNPTGAVLDAATLDGILRLAEERDLVVISDEVYLDLALEGTAVSASSRGRDRVFSILSLSKAFSMTGWRIGFTVTPPGLAPYLAAVLAQLTASVSSVAQHAAVAALAGPGQELSHRRRVFRERRDAVHGYLSEHHIPHTVPRGAFYQILPLPDGHDSMAEALALLREGVAVVPGTAFGEPDGPFLRLCLTAQTPTLIAGIDLVRQRLW